MENLINNINNLEIKEVYETLLVNGKDEIFCIMGNDVFHLNTERNWIWCCNIVQFIEFKKNLNIIYLSDIKVKREYEKLRKNNEILERSKDGKVWRRICSFNNGQCYNYSIASCGSFCKSHKTGVINEKISNTKMGDIIEEWVYDQLCKSDELVNVKNVGRDNGKLDIIFQVKDEVNKNINQFRGIQVKQLIINRENGYYISDLKKYDEETLIVGVSEDKKYMCLIFNIIIGDLDGFYFSINDYKDKKYSQYIFGGLDDNSLGYIFFDKLIKCCKKSTIDDDSQFSKTNLKENKMINKLKEKCEENNLTFEPCDSSDSSIDVYINEKKVQCKYSSILKNNLYQFSLDHTINNKAYQPYSENDVDFFIFKHEKEDSFSIIPQSVLLHFGYLKTEEIESKTTKKLEGKTTLTIYPSSYEENHWTKQFINRFDLINEEYDLDKLINLDNPFDKFQNKCKLKNIECTRDMSDLKITNGFIGDKTFKLMTSKRKHRKLYYFSTNISDIPYHIEDENVPNFFIFRIEIEEFHDDFYIIPKDILIKQEVIGSGDKKGKRTFGLPEPIDDKNQKQWVFKYLNNFDLLKDKKPEGLPEELPEEI